MGVREGSTQTGASGELPRGETFDILGNDRRRYAIRYLLESGRAEIGELAEQVAAREYDEEPAAVDSTQRHRVYATLQQTHLPRMEDAGVVRRDAEGVQLTEVGEELRDYLIRTSAQTRWTGVYVGLAVLSTLALEAAIVWVLIRPVAVAAGVVVAFLLAATVQVTRRS